jgi:hypothetical protein
MGNPILDDIRRLKRELAALQSMKIRIGVQGDEDSEILMIASVHEFGCTIKVTPKMRGFFRHNFNANLKNTTEYINIPERSFIRASFDAGRPALDAFIRDKFRAVIKGELTAAQAADKIGLYAAEMTKNFIREGKVEPPITDLAKEQRASTTETPLYDTGANIVDRITFQIEGGGNG